jgi:hypothetical protein
MSPQELRHLIKGSFLLICSPPLTRSVNRLQPAMRRQGGCQAIKECRQPRCICHSVALCLSIYNLRQCCVGSRLQNRQTRTWPYRRLGQKITFTERCYGKNPSNKPLEWTGHLMLSVAQTQAPCLPLRGSVGPSRCAADSTARVYEQASISARSLLL